MSFNNIAIFYVKGNAYIIHFWYMSKDGAINIMNGFILTDKRGVLSESNSVDSADLTYYQRNRDTILNRAKDYYKNDKERLSRASKR